MADEIKKVITVDVSGAVSSLDTIRSKTEESGQTFKTLGDAKKYIDSLKASLLDLDQSSDEYKQTCDEITDVQNRLNSAIKAGSDSAAALDGSYNALSKQMSELKKQWKATNDEAERESVGKQISAINNQLKEMDASIGNYQRNVGNYEGAFTSAFDKMTDGLDKIVPGTRGVYDGVIKITGAVKALKTASMTNPWTAVLTGIATILAGIVSQWDNIREKIGLAKDEAVDYKAEIEAANTAFQKQTTELEYQLALRKLAGEDEVSLQQSRIDNIQKEIDKEQESIRRRREWLEIYKESSGVSKELYKQREEEYQLMVDRKNELSDELNKENRKLNLLIRQQEIADEAQRKREEERKSQEAATKAAKEKADIDKKAADEKRVADEQQKKIQTDLNTLTKYEIDASDKLLEDKERELAVIERTYTEQLSLYEKYQKDSFTLTAAYEKEKGEIIARYAKEAEEKRLAAQKEAEEKADKRLGDIDSEAALAQYIADKTIQIEYEKNQKLLELDRERLLQKKITLEELIADDTLSAEKKKEYAEQLAQVNADIVSNSEQSKNAEKLHAKEIVNTYTELTTSLGSLMSTIAGIWEDNINARYEAGEITAQQAEEEFENNKKMQIASAVLTGLAGVAAAIASPVAAAMGPPGWIAAGVQAAVIAASTAAQIVKLKQTKFSSGSSTSAAGSSVASVPTAAVTNYTPNYTASVSGRSESIDLANAVQQQKTETKVYVVESDIRAAGDRVEVRDSESTF